MTVPPSGEAVLWAAMASAASLVISLGVTLVALVRLPPEAFTSGRILWPRTTAGLLLRLAANLAGWILIAIGIVLSVPGVPGQGLLTILLGLLLVDVPGRTRLLRKILARPMLRRGIDRLRARFRRPPVPWDAP